MSPLAVFFRALSRSSAICLGIGLAIVNPPFDWSPGRAMTSAAQLTGVTAQKSPSEGAIDGLFGALKDEDACVRRAAAVALAALGDSGF
jgi:HEAT repeat protein